ncbi:MAG: peptide chain release factor 2 [Planctomycetes bacterium]|nr:peptide chain release factor 2 [Planctomycetota bacterium]
MSEAGFWNDQESASVVVQAAKRAKGVVDPVKSAEAIASDIEVLVEMGEEDEDAVADDIETSLDKLETELDKLEFRVMLGGEHDHRNAILNIQAGAGGVDACDWAEMLLRMYLRWLERMDFEFEEIDYQPAEEAGIKSVSILVKGPFAYGYLKAEQGVHRLVRISPFDAQNRRQTSFASIEVVPEFDEDIEVEILDKDLRVDTFRASGAGGQHVNKTDSAIRITHLPTGIVVSCQNERSQHKNRATAMKVLKAKLYQVELAKREESLKAFYGDRGSISWGNQIRSYVLQPYQMVKDLRTGHENGNTQAVLDGELTPFMEAWLRGQRRKK